MDSDTFVTAFYCVYDPAQLSLTYASAGHNPPRLKHCSDGTLDSLDGAKDLPLGIAPEIRNREGAMVTYGSKREDMAQEQQEQRSVPNSWDKPLLLAGLGLTLMLGGYAALDYLLGARVAIFGGLILFVLAGALMYRNSPPPTDDGNERE